MPWRMGPVAPIGLRVRRSKERPPRATVALIRALCLPRHLSVCLVLYVSIAGTRQHRSFFVPAASAVCVRCRRGRGWRHRPSTALGVAHGWCGVGLGAGRCELGTGSGGAARRDQLGGEWPAPKGAAAMYSSIAALEINSTQRDTHEVGVVGAPIVCIRGVRVTVCSIADFPSTVTQPHQGR